VWVVHLNGLSEMKGSTWEEVLFWVSKPQGLNTPRFGPAPQVHPWGPGYSIHPELTRSGAGYFLSRLALPAAVMASTITATTTLSSEGGEPGALFTSYPGIGSSLDHVLN